MNAIRPGSSLLSTFYARLTSLAAVLEKHWRWVLGLCVAYCLGCTLVLDAKRPMWNDELFTYYISRQPTMSDIWRALSTGAEQLPPFFYVLVRGSTSIFGSGRIGFRLPETVGFLVMSLAAFTFMRKRSSAAYGLVAFTFPFLTYAFYFAYEARPYGLVMGFCGGAILCWQHATEHGRRSLSLVGLTLCLAAALACHYYAVLVLFPFALAECARLVRSHRFDLPMYCALAASGIPVLLSLPLLRASSQYAGKFWAKPQWTMMISFYEDLLRSSAFALLLLLLLAGLAVWLRSGTRPPVESRTAVPIHEVILALGLVLIPVLAIVVAKLVTGAFTSRYAIYAVLGIAILLAFSLSVIAARSAVIGFAAAMALLLCWTVIVVREGKTFAANSENEARTFHFLQKLSVHHPLVIAGPHVFFQMSYQADIHHTGQFLFLADVGRALRYTDTDTVERGLLVLQKVAPLHVEDYRAYSASHSNFLLYDSGAAFSWILGDLIGEGRLISIYADAPQGRVYAIGPRGADAATAPVPAN